MDYKKDFIRYDRNCAAGIGLTIISGIITILALIILSLIFGFEQAKEIASVGVFGIIGGIAITFINSKLQDACYNEYKNN